MEPEIQHNQPESISLQSRRFGPKFFIILLLILFVGSIAYGFIWWWGNKNSEVAIPSVSTTIDSSANWSSYSNLQYGFEFKYPNGWSIRDVSSADSNPNTKFNNVQVGNATSYIEFTSSIAQDTGADSGTSGPDVAAGGVTWKTYRAIGGLGDQHNTLTLVSSLLYGKYFEISIYPNDDLTVSNPIFNQILATFKFLH